MTYSVMQIPADFPAFLFLVAVSNCACFFRVKFCWWILEFKYSVIFSKEVVFK